MKAAVAAGVLLAALSVTPSPAQPALPDTEPHLLLVPDTPEGTAALGRSDARTVARYESFSLVEAAGDDAGRLRRAGADRRDDMRTVATAAGAIDPTVDRAPLAAKDAPDRERTLALVQFTGPPKDAWLERLRATGARLVGYQPENAYLVHARGDAVDRVAGLLGTDPAVRAVSVVTAADKLFDSSSPSGIFAVTSVKGESHGASLRAPVTLGAQRTEYLALSPAEAARLAADPGVISIQAHDETRSCSTSAERRSSLATCGAHPRAAARLPRLADSPRGSRPTPSTSRSTSPTAASTTAPILPPIPISQAASPTWPTTPRTPTRATAPATAPTSRRSPPARAGRGRRTRTPAASTTALASRRSRGSASRSTSTATARRRRPSTTPRRPPSPMRPAPGSRTTPGDRPAATTRSPPRSTTSSCATPARIRAIRPWWRSCPPGTTGGTATPRSATRPPRRTSSPWGRPRACGRAGPTAAA